MTAGAPCRFASRHDAPVELFRLGLVLTFAQLPFALSHEIRSYLRHRGGRSAAASRSSIARWLASVVRGNMEDERYCGLENDLSFVYVGATGEGFRFAVCLRYGLSHDQNIKGDASIVNVQLTPEQLLTAVRYFRGEYQSFPVRGDEGRRGLSKLLGPQKLKWP